MPEQETTTSASPATVQRFSVSAPVQDIPIVRTGPITFDWNASPSDGVTTYRFYPDAAAVAFMDTAGALEYTVADGFQVGEHTLAVTAVNSAGEESDPAAFTFRVISKPLPPSNVHIVNPA